MRNRWFRGLHILAVVCVLQYIAIRVYTWNELGTEITPLEYFLWVLIVHLLVFEPIYIRLRRSREEIRASLEYQVEKRVSSLRFVDKKVASMVQELLLRRCREQGLLPDAGWSETVDLVVRQLSRRWGKVPQPGLILHAVTAQVGFLFDAEQTERFDAGLSQAMERYAPASPQGMDRLQYRADLAREYVVGVAMRLHELNEFLELDQTALLQASPDDFALAIELYCLDDTVTDLFWCWEIEGTNQCAGVDDFFRVMHHCQHLGIDSKDLRRYIGHNGGYSFVFLDELLRCGVVDAQVLHEITQRPDTFKGVRKQDLQALIDRWRRYDCPGTLKSFRRFPTDEAYEAHLREQEAERVRREQETAERRAEEEQKRAALEAANAPKGIKRGQARAPKPEPVTHDLSTLEQALEVPAAFGEKRELMRTIIVRGLMRVGDRVPPWHQRPARNRNKLWQQIRRCVPTVDKPRRAVDAAVRELLAHKVLTRDGENFRLADPTERQKRDHPNGHQLLVNAKALVKSAQFKSKAS